ncbi:uncharacterized protein BJ171DRAFT_630668 [Polychytrium aggregatum]|uniref:uncharacterized protein n=1 Tax=Polychytrium aggregatum TaxID=110093 RepID=UPI0022FEB6AB|nr:uncharacterized protein BJ171DRAFT_630668 [Polychytrium aggregatum]KAI9199588.1 hypothetical protein BJ171DRAFT_630668 [Polychytrium aggregatum]
MADLKTKKALFELQNQDRPRSLSKKLSKSNDVLADNSVPESVQPSASDAAGQSASSSNGNWSSPRAVYKTFKSSVSGTVDRMSRSFHNHPPGANSAEPLEVAAVDQSERDSSELPVKEKISAFDQGPDSPKKESKNLKKRISAALLTKSKSHSNSRISMHDPALLSLVEKREVFERDPAVKPGEEGRGTPKSARSFADKEPTAGTPENQSPLKSSASSLSRWADDTRSVKGAAGAVGDPPRKGSDAISMSSSRSFSAFRAAKSTDSLARTEEELPSEIESADNKPPTPTSTPMPVSVPVSMPTPASVPTPQFASGSAPASVPIPSQAPAALPKTHPDHPSVPKSIETALADLTKTHQSMVEARHHSIPISRRSTSPAKTPTSPLSKSKEQLESLLSNAILFSDFGEDDAIPAASIQGRVNPPEVVTATVSSASRRGCRDKADSTTAAVSSKAPPKPKRFGTGHPAAPPKPPRERMQEIFDPPPGPPIPSLDKKPKRGRLVRRTYGVTD